MHAAAWQPYDPVVLYTDHDGKYRYYSVGCFEESTVHTGVQTVYTGPVTSRIQCAIYSIVYKEQYTGVENDINCNSIQYILCTQ